MSQTMPDTRSLEPALAQLRAALATEDYGQAGLIANEALAAGFVHPALFNARALNLERQGREEDALGNYRQALALTPKNAQLLNAIGLCQTRLGRYEEAVKTFDEAIAIAPAHAPSHHRKGLALGLWGQWDRAERAHARAAQLDPRHADALASVAVIAARRGEAARARAHAERALRVEPDNATAHVALALLEMEESKFEDAERRLTGALANPALSGHGRMVAMGLLADTQDGQGKTREAFASYAAANAHLAEIQGLRSPLARTATDDIAALADAVAALGHGAWKTVDAHTTAQPRQVFILSFPRSGTTLLGRAFAARDDARVIEEKDHLEGLAQRYLSGPTGVEVLAELEGPSLGVAREDYWGPVREAGGYGSALLVDKNPLHSLKLPLIARLFPEAKILFAVRDPRDVVLSCFRRHLTLELARGEPLTIERVAQLYDATMRFAETCREHLPLSVCDVRYEDLAADFDGTTRAVCTFLDIPWQKEMREFARAATSLDTGHASARQVRRELYPEGRGRWQAYANELAPVLPLLEPWVKRFGYE